MERINIVPHDSNWRAMFAEESYRLADAIGENTTAIHHIGSTSIPGIYAKPVIDMLIEVKNLVEVDTRSRTMEALGYQVMGEFGIEGRRYFRKDNAIGVRTHQVHIFETGSPQLKRHLGFRDYLIAHPDEAKEYSELKQKLVSGYSSDPESYIDGKDGFIKKIDERAAAWR